MRAIEAARKLAELQETEKAQRAYGLALGEGELQPEEELEAASYLFFSEADHKLPFTTFVSLFNRGFFQGELLELMTQAFYLPNVKKQKKQYESNVKALSAYPYLFRKDFPAFEELPLLFFPFDHQGFVPYDTGTMRFGDYVNVNEAVIDRWFFKDLSKPILARDVYSQYQLEYLNDNVRKSEWVAKENHIYLHYTDWLCFCSWLAVLNVKKLLNEQKIVFLMEEEIARYPIDFQREYGLDYSQYPLKPVSDKEITRLIWHTQFASDCGGDFFNEVMYGHPNLMVVDSTMFHDMEKKTRKVLHELRELQKKEGTGGKARLTEKDAFVRLCRLNDSWISMPDPASRITPAVFFQPHFPNIYYEMETMRDKRHETRLWSEEYEAVRTSPLFQSFPYIKTITPIRRPSTSYAGSLRFAVRKHLLDELEKDEGMRCRIPAQLAIQLLNRSYLKDPQDRLFQDSRLVRFEDGKLNPKATFMALAEFLDIPYTESMTYCSNRNGLNPRSYETNYTGFDPTPVYNSYEEVTNDAERAFLEYFLRDVYAHCGYDFQYYQGETVDRAWVRQKVEHARLWEWVGRSLTMVLKEEIMDKEEIKKQKELSQEALEEQVDIAVAKMAEQHVEKEKENLIRIAENMLQSLCFVSKSGQPLQFIKMLELDPALLERPLYHSGRDEEGHWLKMIDGKLCPTVRTEDGLYIPLNEAGTTEGQQPLKLK